MRVLHSILCCRILLHLRSAHSARWNPQRQTASSSISTSGEATQSISYASNPVAGSMDEEHGVLGNTGVKRGVRKWGLSLTRSSLSEQSRSGTRSWVRSAHGRTESDNSQTAMLAAHAREGEGAIEMDVLDIRPEYPREGYGGEVG